MRAVIAVTSGIERAALAGTNPLGPLNMLKVETRTGRQLILAPESLFGLCAYGGLVEMSAGKGLRRALVPAVEARQNIGFTSGFVTGLVLANGTYPNKESVPASFRIAGGKAELADWLAEAIRLFGATKNLRDKNGYVWRLKKSTDILPLDLRISSRLIDHMIESTSPALVRYVTNDVDFDTLDRVSMTRQQGFISGVLAGMTPTEEGLVFRHRSAPVIRQLANYLYEDFGVPVDVSINQAEPQILPNLTRIKNPHHFVLPTRRFDLIKRFDLFPDEPSELASGSDQFFDTITNIAPCAADAMEVIVSPDGPDRLVVDGFQVKAEFEPPIAAIEVATMIELFQAVERDPRNIIAARRPDMTHKFGAI